MPAECAGDACADGEGAAGGAAVAVVAASGVGGGAIARCGGCGKHHRPVPKRSFSAVVPAVGLHCAAAAAASSNANNSLNGGVGGGHGMASLEADLKRQILGRSKAEKVFRPWWDTLEDYLLNCLVLLGESSLRDFLRGVLQRNLSPPSLEFRSRFSPARVLCDRTISDTADGKESVAVAVAVASSSSMDRLLKEHLHLQQGRRVCNEVMHARSRNRKSQRVTASAV